MVTATVTATAAKKPVIESSSSLFRGFSLFYHKIQGEATLVFYHRSSTKKPLPRREAVCELGQIWLRRIYYKRRLILHVCGLDLPSALLGFRGQSPGAGLPNFVFLMHLAPHQVQRYSMVLYCKTYLMVSVGIIGAVSTVAE